MTRKTKYKCTGINVRVIFNLKRKLVLSVRSGFRDNNVKE